MSCVWSRFGNTVGEKTLVGTRSDNPVFCDQSGTRSVVLQWSGRGVALLLLLLCAGLALTLDTRVEVPVLKRLLPAGGWGSELFDAPKPRDRPPHQVQSTDKVPAIRSQTVSRVRDLTAVKPSSGASTVDPAVERRAVTRVPTATTTTPATTRSTTPSVQSSPTREPRPTARPRNPKAADPGENPNAQGSAADTPGHTRSKAKVKARARPRARAATHRRRRQGSSRPPREARSRPPSH
jgi:hypothetical protein